MLNHVVRRAFVFCIVMIAIHAYLNRANAAEAKSESPPEMLTGCLAVAADGSPVWPGTSFPAAKKLTVAFRINTDQNARKLISRWISLDGDEKAIAENSLDLKGQKSGWLRLELKQPAPPGKYRLEAMLDEKPWRSIDIEITAPIEQGKAENAAQLIPLNEGTLSYQLVTRGSEHTKVEIPGVKPDADGTSRATLTMQVGKTDDSGTNYILSINDKPVGEMWVKVGENGLEALRKKSGKEIKDLNPPELVQPLPPALENGTEWKATTKQGEESLELFGPLPMESPNGAAAGYLIFSEVQVSAGAPGSEAIRGKDTVERYYIPKVGLVREVHVSTMAGKFASRQEIALGSVKAYKIVANSQMKGRLGRVQFSYPPDTKSSEARVAVFKSGAKDDKALFTGYGDAGYDLLPGKYEAAIHNKRVPIEVKSGHITTPSCGVLRIHAGSETRFKVVDPATKKECLSAYGEHDIPLPVGTYTLEIAGGSESIEIKDGQVTEF